MITASHVAYESIAACLTTLRRAVMAQQQAVGDAEVHLASWGCDTPSRAAQIQARQRLDAQLGDAVEALAALQTAVARIQELADDAEIRGVALVD